MQVRVQLPELVTGGAVLDGCEMQTLLFKTNSGSSVRDASTRYRDISPLRYFLRVHSQYWRHRLQELYVIIYTF